MNILIDTNIIRQDLKFRDRNFDILLDYLSKTNSFEFIVKHNKPLQSDAAARRC